MKPCPVRGCGALILASKLACQGHYRMLPEELRDELKLLGINRRDSHMLADAQAEAVDYLNGLPADVRLSA